MYNMVTLLMYAWGIFFGTQLTLLITVQTQGHNIRTYSEYLLRRAIEYGNTKVDYVRNGEARFKRLTVEKGLLRETESVQSQIKYLLRCQVGNVYIINAPHGIIT